MPLVLSVGQCGPDDYRIGRLLRQEFSAEVERAADAGEAQRLLAEKNYDLVLVNRVFDATGDSGVEFIRALKAGGTKVPVMLVSDYPEAQAQAVASGALAGFGKSALGSPQADEQLRAVLSARAPE